MEHLEWVRWDGCEGMRDGCDGMGALRGVGVMGPVSGKPRSTPQGMPLTGQSRSDGLRAHPKCVVIDSDGEGRGRVRESCGR